MKYDSGSNKAQLDALTTLIYVVLVLLGLLNIYSVNYDPEYSEVVNFGSKHGKQFIFILIAFAIGYTFYLFDTKFFQVFATPIYVVSLLLLLMVLFFGKEVAGNKSWIDLGFISLQPSEFAKFSSSLMLAAFLSEPEVKWTQLRTRLFSALIIGLPILLILLQGDAGSALVFFSFLLMLYREGMPGWILWGLFAMILLFIGTLLLGIWVISGIILTLTVLLIAFTFQNRQFVYLVLLVGALAFGYAYSVGYVFNEVLKPHQKIRIEVLLGMKEDLKGAGYNVHQSKIAIGSGGFNGKGFLKGTQTKGDFVPEQSTDFIFCTIGEEWGFLGSLAVILLFLILIIRLVVIAERQRNRFSRIYAYCVACIFFFHFTINIGMTIGLMPVIGIPLPFFSYGGSSLISFTVLLFVLLKQDANRVNEFPAILD